MLYCLNPLSRYSYGEQVKGAYHCQFGVSEKDKTQKIKPLLIRGLELTDSVRKQISLQNFISRSEIRSAGNILHLFQYLTINNVCHSLQVRDGAAAASFQIEDWKVHLLKQQNKTLSELQQRGAQLYLRVFVTNIQSKRILCHTNNQCSK